MQIETTAPIQTVATLTNGFIVFKTMFDGVERYYAATRQAPFTITHSCEHGDLLRFVRELGVL